MNPISIALKGKRLSAFLRRAVSISFRYGITPRKMERALAQYVAVLHQFGIGASFAITSPMGP